jgi:hypothetical protein
MPFLPFIAHPVLRIAALIASTGTLGFAASTVAIGCLTAPPPALQEVSHRPTILPNETPPIDVPLVYWPADDLFSAYVDVDPGASFAWAAFEDYNPSAAFSGPFRTAPGSALPGGGPVPVSFILSQPPDDGLCHRIDLVVADMFGPGVPTDPSFFHTPTGSYGGDVVTWWYTGGLGIANCSPYGGALPDGGYPLPDASSDSPPPVPE